MNSVQVWEGNGVPLLMEAEKVDFSSLSLGFQIEPVMITLLKRQGFDSISECADIKIKDMQMELTLLEGTALAEKFRDFRDYKSHFKKFSMVADGTRREGKYLIEGCTLEGTKYIGHGNVTYVICFDRITKQ